MPAATRTVRVHGAEVSTEPSQLLDYAQAFALLLAIVAVAAAAWMAMAPRQDADIPQPPVIAPARGEFERLPTDTRDVLQPDPDGPGEVAVVRPEPVIGPPLGPTTP